MKKLFFGVILAGSFLLTGSVFASDYCFDFGGNDEVCLSVDKDSSSRFHFDATVRGGGIALCHLETPDGKLHLIDDCDDTFIYHGNNTSELKIYVRYDNQYKTWNADYDFNDGRFVGNSSYNNTYNNTYNNNYNNNSSYYFDDFDLSTSDSRPRVNELVDVTIAAVDSRGYRESDFEGRVYFAVEERRSGRWQRANSNDYDIDFTSYSFDRYDNGFKRLHNFLKFEDGGDYRLKVSSSNVVSYMYFSVGGSSSSYTYSYNNVDELSLSANDRSPRVYQDIDLTIEVLDDDRNILENFRGTVYFSVEHRSSTSRRTASSSDFDLARRSYTFTSSDDGEKILRDLLRFSDDGDFRLRVTTNGATNYIYFTVDEYSSNNTYYNNYTNSTAAQKFTLHVDDTTPRFHQDVDLTIQALTRNNNRVTDYRERVYFTVQERSGNSWRQASTRDYDLDRSSFTFRSSDRGYVVLRDLVSFDTSGNYRLKVYDTNGIIEYIYINVSGTSSNYGNTYNSTYGFNSSELRIVSRVYDQRGWYIDDLEDDFPRLRTNATWQRMQSDLYFNMGNVLNNRSSVWNDYGDYYGDFLVFVSYTLNVR